MTSIVRTPISQLTHGSFNRFSKLTPSSFQLSLKKRQSESEPAGGTAWPKLYLVDTNSKGFVIPLQEKKCDSPICSKLKTTCTMLYVNADAVFCRPASMVVRTRWNQIAGLAAARVCDDLSQHPVHAPRRDCARFAHAGSTACPQPCTHEARLQPAGAVGVGLCWDDDRQAPGQALDAALPGCSVVSPSLVSPPCILPPCGGCPSCPSINHHCPSCKEILVA